MSVRATGSAGEFCREPAGPAAVLNRGGVHNDRHPQPLAIDQVAVLAAVHLLASVVTHLTTVYSIKIFRVLKFKSSITIVHDFFGVFRVTSMLTKHKDLENLIAR